MTAVDARFAGGAITVTPGHLPDVDSEIVRLSIPGSNTIDLFRHEARALAHALLDGGGVTDAGSDRDAAEEIAVTLHRDRGAPAESIAILSTSGIVEQQFDRDGALALAARLIELSRELPEPPRVLRRHADAAAHFGRAAELY